MSNKLARILKDELIRAMDKTSPCAHGRDLQPCPSCIAETMTSRVRLHLVALIVDRCEEAEHKSVSGELSDGRYGTSTIVCEDCEALIDELLPR